MIALDLGLLNNTYLPHIIHDSIVIKNVEREAVENIVKTYAVQSKQVFLAIDEVPKYSPKTQAILEEKCFLQLTKISLLSVFLGNSITKIMLTRLLLVNEIPPPILPLKGGGARSIFAIANVKSECGLVRLV